MQRFSYVKSDVGEIVITIAYEEIENKVFYGVSCISLDEKFSNKAQAKSIAVGRCQQAVINGFDMNKGIAWKPYFVEGNQNLNYRNALVNYCETNSWNKLGAMKVEDFASRLKALKRI